MQTGKGDAWGKSSSRKLQKMSTFPKSAVKSMILYQFIDL